MSSGSYFTLYRKYNAKASDEVFNALVDKYVEEYKSDGIFNKKTDDEIRKNLPLIINLNVGVKESKYDEATKEWKDIKDYSIDSQRMQYHAILTTDKSYLDELLRWNFCSSFNVLKHEWTLDSYASSKTTYIVEKHEAEKMLQACNYLLSEKWSIDFEKILDNSWIRTLAEGNESESLWKYVYRNDKKALREMSREEIESPEYDLRRLQNVLNAFVYSEEDYTSYGTVSNILTYTVW